MPPKVKFSREEIIEKAFEMARENGIDSVVARELGKRLGTSSSPIFTAFKNMEELQQAVRDRAMKEFEAYVKDAVNYVPGFKYVGMKMVEFAMKEPNLFRLLYMREHDCKQTYSMFVEELGDTALVCIELIERDYNLNKEEARLVFEQVWLHTFAICVLLAGKVCKLTMEEVSTMLSVGFQGTLMVVKSGNVKTVPINNR